MFYFPSCFLNFFKTNKQKTRQNKPKNINVKTQNTKNIENCTH